MSSRVKTLAFLVNRKCENSHTLVVGRPASLQIRKRIDFIFTERNQKEREKSEDEKFFPILFANSKNLYMTFLGNWKVPS
ncbi:hypothetical protein DLM75_05145 [Leptospira stimsonii]|uniref:Uncharacterized protein n=1 Tax=Leptospira stimsonii TaxID=2202203 RepID=A0A396ZFU2_9LEPT|nr:hypothetical protein DLM75_05145 [Leptospira stimsonii]